MTIEFLAKMNRREGDLVEQYLDRDDRLLLRAARGVDVIDRISGPLASTLQLYGSPFWQGVGIAISALELGLVKIPFMYAYQKQTKDFASLYTWGAKEAFANGFAIAGYVDVLHSYTYLARKHFEKQVRRKE